MQHTLLVLVEDKPGVLNRIASLFRRRVFNIESLTVSRTVQPGMSRMTIVIDTDQSSADRVIAYLCRLVNVVEVDDVPPQSAVACDLAMVKVAATPAQRTAVLRAIDETHAHIVDAVEQTMTIEITGEAPRVDAAIERLSSLGIVEMVRTGQVALRRGDAALASVSASAESA